LDVAFHSQFVDHNSLVGGEAAVNNQIGPGDKSSFVGPKASIACFGLLRPSDAPKRPSSIG
jgi:hypothetical protein